MRGKSLVRQLPLASALSVGLAVLAAGCGKRHPAAAANPPLAPAEAQATNVGSNAAEPSAPTGEAPAIPTATTENTAQASGPPNLDAITLKLHHWIGARQRLPRNFEEFAAENANQIPPPPPGKKYSINQNWRVVLVDR